MKYTMCKGSLRMCQEASKAGQTSGSSTYPGIRNKECTLNIVLYTESEVWMYSVECWIYSDTTSSTYTLDVPTPFNELTYHPHIMQHNITHRAHKMHTLIALMSWNVITYHPYSMWHDMTCRATIMRREDINTYMCIV